MEESKDAGNKGTNWRLLAGVAAGTVAIGGVILGAFLYRKFKQDTEQPRKRKARKDKKRESGAAAKQAAGAGAGGVDKATLLSILREIVSSGRETVEELAHEEEQALAEGRAAKTIGSEIIEKFETKMAQIRQNVLAKHNVEPAAVDEACSALIQEPEVSEAFGELQQLQFAVYGNVGDTDVSLETALDIMTRFMEKNTEIMVEAIDEVTTADPPIPDSDKQSEVKRRHAEKFVAAKDSLFEEFGIQEREFDLIMMKFNNNQEFQAHLWRLQMLHQQKVQQEFMNRRQKS